MISYEPLWRTMEERNVTTYTLIQCGIDTHTVHNLKQNENITMLTAEKICKIVGCGIADIVEFI